MSDWGSMYGIWAEYEEKEEAARKELEEGMKSATSNKPKCDCGAWKTYGETMNSLYHSRWCSLFKKN